MTYSGYNQEDSLIINGTSLNRGFVQQLFIIQKKMKIKTYTVTKKLDAGQIKVKQKE